MKIIVSACLLGENCKYNGGNNRCQKVIDFVKDHEVFAVCPQNARCVSPILVKVAAFEMKKAFAGRKENELFL